MRIAACVIGLGLILIGACAGYWYHRDRTGFLASLCEIGLPNFSRPSRIEADDLGCAILGSRQRISGTLLTGFEAANFMPDNLPPPPDGGGFTGSTWFNSQSASERQRDALDRQLRRGIPGLCRTGLAYVIFDGWVTVSPGRFGHIGVYSREAFVDEIVTVGPPSQDVLDQMRRRWAEAGIGECSPSAIGR